MNILFYYLSANMRHKRAEHYESYLLLQRYCYPYVDICFFDIVSKITTSHLCLIQLVFFFFFLFCFVFCLFCFVFCFVFFLTQFLKVLPHNMILSWEIIGSIQIHNRFQKL